MKESPKLAIHLQNPFTALSTVNKLTTSSNKHTNMAHYNTQRNIKEFAGVKAGRQHVCGHSSFPVYELASINYVTMATLSHSCLFSQWNQIHKKSRAWPEKFHSHFYSQFKKEFSFNNLLNWVFISISTTIAPKV